MSCFRKKNSNVNFDDLINGVINVFKEAEVNVEERDIDDIKYLGKQEGKNRPILVSFSRTITKKKIFNNVKKIVPQGFFISNDLDVRKREELKKLNVVRKELFL